MKRQTLENRQDRYHPSKTASTFHKVERNTSDEDTIRSIVRQEIMSTLFQIKNEIEQKMKQVDTQLKSIRDELERGVDVAERVQRVEKDMAILKEQMEVRAEVKRNEPLEAIRKWHSEKVHIPSSNLSSVLFPDEQTETSCRSVSQTAPIHPIHQMVPIPATQHILQPNPIQQHLIKKPPQPPSPTKSDDVEAARNRHEPIDTQQGMVNELNRNKKQFMRSKSNKGLPQQNSVPMSPLSPLSPQVQQAAMPTITVTSPQYSNSHIYQPIPTMFQPSVTPLGSTIPSTHYQPLISHLLPPSYPILSVHQTTSNIASSSLIIHEQQQEQSILESPHKY